MILTEAGSSVQWKVNLGQKGFTKSENPDVLIDLKLTAQTKQTATANTSGGYGYGYRYGWGGGFSTTTINYDSLPGRNSFRGYD